MAILVRDAHGDRTGRPLRGSLGGRDRQGRARQRGLNRVRRRVHGVGERGGIHTLGVAHGQRQVLHHGLAPGLDTNSGRGEGRRLVDRGLDAHGQRQGGGERPRVGGIAVRDLDEERGVAAKRGVRVQGQLRVGISDDRVEAVLGHRTRPLDEARAASRASNDVVRQVDRTRGARVHLDRQIRRAEERRGRVATGDPDNSRVGQPIAVGDRVDDQARGFRGRNQQVRAGDGHAGIGGGQGDLVDTAVGVFVVLEDIDGHGGAVRGQRVIVHEVVAGNGCLEGRVILDVDRQGAARGAAATVADRVGHEVGANLGGRVHLDGRAGSDLRVEFGRGRLEAVLLEGERVAVRVQVVRQDIDGHHAIRARQDGVGHRHRVLVQRGNRRNGDTDASRGTRALAILDRVGEGVSAGLRGVGRVLNPRGIRGRRALLRRGIHAAQGHRVAVRVDAVKRDRDAGGLTSRGPRGDVAGTRCLIVVGCCQDLEGDRAGGAVTGGIDDRVGDIHRARGVPRLETHLVTRHEGRPQGGSAIILERRLDLQVQAGRRAIIRQNGDRPHVADTHLASIRLEDRRQIGAVRSTGNDGHAGAGAALPVGHRVREGHRPFDACRRSHAQQVAVDEGHLQAGHGRGINRRDRQDSTRRVVVVGQRRNQHGPALRQDRRIVLGNRGQRNGLNDHDAHNTQRRRDAVGDRVGEGVGTRGRRHEVNGPAFQIRRDRRTRGRTGHSGQHQRVAVGISVVLERIQSESLARVCQKQVAVRDGRQVAGLLDVDNEFAARLSALIVGDGQHDGLRTSRGAFLGDRHRAVLHEGHVQTFGSLGILQEQRVAIGVTPVGQGLILDLRALTDLDRRRTQLRGHLVLRIGVDRHLHPRGGGRGPIRGLVGERRGTRLIGIDVHDLQRATGARDGHRTPCGLAGRAGGQHVSVNVGVIVQDRQDRRTARADAEFVIHGLGRGVLLALFGVGNLVRQLRAVLFVLGLLELVFDLIPVVHEDHVGVGQPYVALRDVVEDDGLTVGAENYFLGALERIDDCLLVVGGVVARAHERARAHPRAVGAALVAHGCCGDAAGGSLGGGDDRGGTALQGDPHQGRGRGQEDGIVRRSGLLEDSARLDACGAEVECLAAGQEEGVRGGVEGDDLVSDGRHRQRRVCGDALDHGGLRLIDGTLPLNSCEGSGRGQGVDGAVHAGDKRARAHVRGDGGIVRKVRRARHGGRRRPQCAICRIQDAQDVPTLHRNRTGGKGRRGPQSDLGNIDRRNSK